MILLGSLILLHLYPSGSMASGPCDVPSSTHEISDGSQVYIYTTDYRSTAQIVVTCLSTMLLCTWFTIHPNIWDDKEPARHSRRKFGMFLWALLTPEVAVAFASSQWFGARAILNRFKEHGWSMAEAHFVQMGGISFTYAGKRQEMSLEDILEPDGSTNQATAEVLALVKLQSLHTSVTQDEITDRSKRDGLAKAIVLVQTSWFMVQCVARAVQGLAITQLEIVTLAYTALNGVMFFFWWDKPLDVHCPVVVHLCPKSGSGADEIQGVSQSTQPAPMSESEQAGSPRGAPKGLFKKILNNCKIGFLHASSSVVPDMVEAYTDKRQSGPYYAYRARHPSRKSKYKCQSQTVLVLILNTFFTGVFGALHCSAWSFSFPSLVANTSWRVCSLYIAFSPVAATLVILMSLRFDLTHLVNFEFLLLFGLLFLYVSARIILLIVAFWCLSAIPATAHRSILWSYFIPHL